MIVEEVKPGAAEVSRPKELAIVVELRDEPILPPVAILGLQCSARDRKVARLRIPGDINVPIRIRRAHPCVILVRASKIARRGDTRRACTLRIAGAGRGAKQ